MNVPKEPVFNFNKSDPTLEETAKNEAKTTAAKKAGEKKKNQSKSNGAKGGQVAGAKSKVTKNAEEEKRLSEEIIALMQNESSVSKTSLTTMLDKKCDDPEQKVRVMRRVRLMLDPTGSAKGKELTPEGYANMTEEQKMQIEADQVMRGLGNKCLRKALESCVFAGILMAILY